MTVRRRKRCTLGKNGGKYCSGIKSGKRTSCKKFTGKCRKSRKSSRKSSSRSRSRSTSRSRSSSRGRKSSGKVMAYNLHSRRKEEMLSPTLHKKMNPRNHKTMYYLKGKARDGTKMAKIISADDAKKY